MAARPQKLASMPMHSNHHKRPKTGTPCGHRANCSHLCKVGADAPPHSSKPGTRPNSKAHTMAASSHNQPPVRPCRLRQKNKYTANTSMPSASAVVMSAVMLRNMA